MNDNKYLFQYIFFKYIKNTAQGGNEKFKYNKIIEEKANYKLRITKTKSLMDRTQIFFNSFSLFLLIFPYLSI
jgi:hypothetical protein